MDYFSLDEALSAGIKNMTVIRNNNRGDSATDIYTIPIGFFSKPLYFNGFEIKSLHSHGDSYFGFNSATTHLQIGKRDGAVYSVFAESATILGFKFVRYRWEGVNVYTQPFESVSKQCWDVFIFEDNRLFVRVDTIPVENFTSSVTSLTSGGNIYPFVPVYPGPYYCTFTPTNSLGDTWTMVEEIPAIDIGYDLSGTVTKHIDLLPGMIAKSKITWMEVTPVGTTVTVSVSTDNLTFSPVTNTGVAVPDKTPITNGLYIKVDLTTDDDTKTPTIRDLSLSIYTGRDLETITLILEPLERMHNAAGPITVTYSGGAITGIGGAVAPFSETFTAEGLVAKPNQQAIERISFNNTVSANLMTVYTSHYGAQSERISVQFSVTSTITNVDEL